MKDKREICKALLDGKTIISKDDTFEMKPADWIMTNSGEIYNSTINDISESQLFGMKYHTKELAERARNKMKEANLLRYWASVVDPTWEADWDNTNQRKWFIDYYANNYSANFCYTDKRIGTVYMSATAVNSICEALNSKELVL